MSVKDLQAHIEKLSVDIDRQKEILKQLTQSKSAAQRQLNSILDPVARLPLEISSEIFIRCLPPLPKPGASHVPMLLLNICNTWTDIALSTPALWASIHINFPRGEGFSEVFAMWLERARNRSLSISLHKSFDDGVETLVWQHAPHIKNFAIYSDEDHLSLSTNAGLFPSLETLTIGGLPDENDDLPLFRCQQILKILCLAPNLVECTFNNFFIYDHPLPESSVLRSLQHLRFAFEDLGEADHSNGFIKYMTLPALQTLALPINNASGPDIISFFERSSPSLLHLTLAVFGALHVSQVEGCLRLLPTLTTFEFHAHRILVNQLFTALAESSSDFLPNLRSMKIHDYPLMSPEELPSYEALLLVLSSRRNQIFRFELSSDDLEWNIPQADTLVGFQQLVADGMEIHIGTHSQSFLS
ncbi:hypothetical protein C8R44DRAFT_346617 [Mycena epipterygia]|nr:hypothetical protein C8R44DRAFT_346617 [Mycena epipterygia]